MQHGVDFFSFFFRSSTWRAHRFCRLHLRAFYFMKHEVSSLARLKLWRFVPSHVGAAGKSDNDGLGGMLSLVQASYFNHRLLPFWIMFARRTFPVSLLFGGLLALRSGQAA